jgi:DeoR family ulaG and ulaABCDEF operon transcriptional repressor
MDHHDRHKRLLKLVAEHGSASVSELAGLLGVSPSTVRRDMRLLGRAGQIKRVRGGCERIDVRHGATLKSHAFRDRVLLHAESKLAIARCAASLCRDGDTILIGGGTTASGMATFLADRRMRVLTNSFEVARQLLEASENEVILSGGRIYPEQDIILSPFDTEAVQYCYADKLFIGVHALSALGLREADPLLVQAGRRLIRQTQQVIVLADSSKFANRDGMFLCGLDQVSCVITDTGVSPEAVRMLEQAGIEVRQVSSDPHFHYRSPARPAAIY